MAITSSISVTAATFHFRQGIDDGFALPTDPATPSPGLVVRFAAFAPFRNYDASDINRFFLETCGNLPMCIVSAELTLDLRPVVIGDAFNDTVGLTFTNPGGAAAGPTWSSFIGNPSSTSNLVSPPWNTTNYPSGATITLDIDNLPTSSGPVSLLDRLRDLKYIDITMQDDTNIDYLDLLVETALDGDIDGDGCVDTADFALLASHFNQPTPNGVGDPNGDGTLNIQDLALLQRDFGRCCPEPSSLAYCAVVLLGALVCGRRRPMMAYIPKVEIARFILFVVVLTASVAWGSTSTASGPFRFVKIADTSTIIPNGPGGTFTQLFVPSVSAGKVAFRGYGATSVSTNDWGGFYTDLPGTLTRVTDGTGSTGTNVLYDPSIDGNVIAYQQPAGPFNARVSTWSGGVSTVVATKSTTAPPGGSGPFDILERPSVDGGKVAFRGFASPPSFNGIFTDATGILTNVIKSGLTPVPPAATSTFTTTTDPDFDGGEIVFWGQASSGVVGIYRANPLSFGPTRVVDSSMMVPNTSVTFNSLSDKPSFDGSDVSFNSFYSGGTGVFRTLGGSIVTVADHSTPIPNGVGNFNLLFLATAIDGNYVVFDGRGSGTQRGIFLHNAATSMLCEVLSVGDSLDGKVVRNVEIGREALDGNKLGIWVRFNSEGIYLTMVPEPASAALLAIGACGCIGVPRRRRR
jgi:hypothetical protein